MNALMGLLFLLLFVVVVVVVVVGLCLRFIGFDVREH
jgi:hypothetical protein